MRFVRAIGSAVEDPLAASLPQRPVEQKLHSVINEYANLTRDILERFNAEHSYLSDGEDYGVSKQFPLGLSTLKFEALNLYTRELTSQLTRTIKAISRIERTAHEEGGDQLASLLDRDLVNIDNARANVCSMMSTGVCYLSVIMQPNIPLRYAKACEGFRRAREMAGEEHPLTEFFHQEYLALKDSGEIELIRSAPSLAPGDVEGKITSEGFSIRFRLPESLLEMDSIASPDEFIDYVYQLCADFEKAASASEFKLGEFDSPISNFSIRNVAANKPPILYGPTHFAPEESFVGYVSRNRYLRYSLINDYSGEDDRSPYNIFHQIKYYRGTVVGLHLAHGEWKIVPNPARPTRGAKAGAAGAQADLA